MTLRFANADEVVAAVGTSLGTTEWEPVSSDDVAAFGHATRALEPVHFDGPAAEASPYGVPVVHGYLTLALATHFLIELVDIHGFIGINYGVDRARFPAAVPVGARLRATGTLLAAERFGDGIKTSIELVYECDATEKPPCVATVLSVLIPEPT